MATPAQLLNVIASTTGVPLPTLVDIDRRLVTAGLRRKAGRGRSAVQMSTLDAARLLTVLLGSSQANTSVEALERYFHAYHDKVRLEAAVRNADCLEDLVGLPAKHSFVDALETVIFSTSSGSLAPLMNGTRPARIEIFAFTGATRGRIRLSGLPKGAIANFEYAASGERKAAGDLEQSRRVTEQTILAIAKLLAKESQYDRG
jgi:hypothetical protein